MRKPTVSTVSDTVSDTPWTSGCRAPYRGATHPQSTRARTPTRAATHPPAGPSLIGGQPIPEPGRRGAPMSSADVLHVLRARGYRVALDGGELSVQRDTPPKDPERAAALLREHRPALVELLRVEQTPVVRAALDVFPGARLVRVERPALPWPAGASNRIAAPRGHNRRTTGATDAGNTPHRVGSPTDSASGGEPHAA